MALGFMLVLGLLCRGDISGFWFLVNSTRFAMSGRFLFTTAIVKIQINSYIGEIRVNPLSDY